MFIEKIQERVRRKIEIDESGCWIWTGATIRKGKVAKGKLMVEKKVVYVHRHLFELANRTKLTKFQILLAEHSCHELCVNPAHHTIVERGVFLEMLKFKSAFGEKNPSAKLNWEIVGKIRSSARNARWWAKKLDVSIWTIHNVRSRKTWPTTFFS